MLCVSFASKENPLIEDLTPKKRAFTPGQAPFWEMLASLFPAEMKVENSFPDGMN